MRARHPKAFSRPVVFRPAYGSRRDLRRSRLSEVDEAWLRALRRISAGRGFRIRPERAADRRHCRSRLFARRSASPIASTDHAFGTKATIVSARRWGVKLVGRGKPRPAKSYRPRRPRRCQADEASARSRPPAHPKSRTPAAPSFPPGSASDRSGPHRDGCKSSQRRAAAQSDLFVTS